MQVRALPRGYSFWHPVSFLSTWFGIGLIPWAPGTWGSIAALPLAWFALKHFGPLGLAAVGVALFLIGCWTATVFARRVNENDPAAIVIDEVAAQCLVLTAAALNPAYFIAGFLLFRLTDILKPWPASWADQSVKGGFGIMLDDVFAGVYAWALLYGVVILFG